MVFDSKALKSGSANKEILHTSVSIWLDTLNEESLRKDKTEVEATRMATELLRDRMFLWDQEKRFSAKDVEVESRKFNPLSQNYLKVQINRLRPKCERRYGRRYLGIGLRSTRVVGRCVLRIA